MTTLELLKAAQERISDRKHWTQGHYAVGPRGEVVAPTDPAAVRWCAIGALYYAAVGHTDTWNAAHHALLRAKGPSNFPFARYNDTHTHAEVLEMFDRAIAAEEAG